MQNPGCTNELLAPLAIVIEILKDDPSKTKMYVQDITASGDVTGKHLISLQTAYLSLHPIQGKPDLVASIAGFALPVIFYNTGSSFRTEEPR